MKSMIACLLLLCSGSAFAAMPVVLATGQGTLYSSSLNAVEAGLKAASAHYRSEYGGIVYELNGHYYYTPPVTVEESSEVRFEIEILRSAHIVALYHTHTPGALSSLFSQDDIEVANKLHVPSYIFVLDKSEIKCYVPGVTPVFERGGGVFQGISDASYGTVVAKLSPLKSVGTYLN